MAVRAGALRFLKDQRDRSTRPKMAKKCFWSMARCINKTRWPGWHFNRVSKPSERNCGSSMLYDGEGSEGEGGGSADDEMGRNVGFEIQCTPPDTLMNPNSRNCRNSVFIFGIHGCEV